ncbi:hypothetical protein [Roseovarius aestuarii]
MHVFAIGITFGLSSNAQGNVEQPESQPEPTKQDTAEQTTVDPDVTAPSVTAPASETSSEHDASATAQSYEQAYQIPEIILGDGWAQWAMAFLALAGVIISAWAVWLLKKTLSATIDAVKEGEKATAASLEAAQAANEANQIMRMEKRPWVTLIHEVACDVHFDRDNFRIAWNYNFENKGLSPAYDVVLEWKPVKNWRHTGIESAIREFAEEAVTRRSGSRTPVLFPGETTKKLRYKSVGVHNYLDGAGHIAEAEPLLLVCISYRLGLGSNEMGVETRVFAFETRDQPLGPFTARMLEYSFARYIN